MRRGNLGCKCGIGKDKGQDDRAAEGGIWRYGADEMVVFLMHLRRRWGLVWDLRFGCHG